MAFLSIHQTNAYKKMQDNHDGLDVLNADMAVQVGEGEFIIQLQRGFYTLQDIEAIARDFKTLNKYVEA